MPNTPIKNLEQILHSLTNEQKRAQQIHNDDLANINPEDLSQSRIKKFREDYSKSFVTITAAINQLQPFCQKTQPLSLDDACAGKLSKIAEKLDLLKRTIYARIPENLFAPLHYQDMDFPEVIQKIRNQMQEKLRHREPESLPIMEFRFSRQGQGRQHINRGGLFQDSALLQPNPDTYHPALRPQPQGFQAQNEGNSHGYRLVRRQRVRTSTAPYPERDRQVSSEAQSSLFQPTQPQINNQASLQTPVRLQTQQTPITPCTPERQPRSESRRPPDAPLRIRSHR